VRLCAIDFISPSAAVFCPPQIQSAQERIGYKPNKPKSL
jgi:hypothetical protein